MNKVILTGNLGADPECRQTASGTAVANLRLATNERRKQGDEWVDHTEWHSVVLFNRQAETAQKYLKKGSKILVEGKLSTRKWTNKEGHDQWSTDVVADRFEFLDSKSDGAGGGGSYGGGGGSYGGGSSKPAASGGDIPF